MKFWRNIKQWFIDRKQIRDCLRTLKFSRDPMDRAHAMYLYICIHLNKFNKGRLPSILEYENLSALIFGNVIASYPNRRAQAAAFKRILKAARMMTNHEAIPEEFMPTVPKELADAGEKKIVTEPSRIILPPGA